MDDRTVPGLPPFPSHLVLPPEFRLAVACSWIAPESQASLQNEMVAANCKAGVDWDAFLALVDRHGIPVQALSVLRRCLGTELPDRLCRALKARSKRTKVRSFVQTCELIRLNRLLREHGIDMLPLKGVALSQRLYGSPDVRASCDIDVLIRPEDLADVDRLLDGIGYKNCLTRAVRLTARQQAALLVGSHHMAYVAQGSGQKIELHWRSRFWSSEDMAAFWRDGQTLSLADEEICFSEDAILFLFLCDHGSRHRWSHLKWLSDITMMVADENMCAWSTVAAMADRLQMRRVVAQAALLVHWLYGLPLPPPLSALVAEEKMAVVLAKKAIAALLGGVKKEGFPLRNLGAEGIDRAAYFLRLRPVKASMRQLKELSICPPADYLAFPLPDRLFWLYLPLRPFLWCLRFYNGRLFSGLRSKYDAE